MSEAADTNATLHQLWGKYGSRAAYLTFFQQTLATLTSQVEACGDVLTQLPQITDISPENVEQLEQAVHAVQARYQESSAATTGSLQTIWTKMSEMIFSPETKNQFESIFKSVLETFSPGANPGQCAAQQNAIAQLEDRCQQLQQQVSTLSKQVADAQSHYLNLLQATGFVILTAQASLIIYSVRNLTNSDRIAIGNDVEELCKEIQRLDDTPMPTDSLGLTMRLFELGDLRTKCSDLYHRALREADKQWNLGATNVAVSLVGFMYFGATASVVSTLSATAQYIRGGVAVASAAQAFCGGLHILNAKAMEEYAAKADECRASVDALSKVVKKYMILFRKQADVSANQAAIRAA